MRWCTTLLYFTHTNDLHLNNPITCVYCEAQIASTSDCNLDTIVSWIKNYKHTRDVKHFLCVTHILRWSIHFLTSIKHRQASVFEDSAILTWWLWSSFMTRPDQEEGVSWCPLPPAVTWPYKSSCDPLTSQYVPRCRRFNADRILAASASVWSFNEQCSGRKIEQHNIWSKLFLMYL